MWLAIDNAIGRVAMKGGNYDAIIDQVEIASLVSCIKELTIKPAQTCCAGHLYSPIYETRTAALSNYTG